MALAGVRVVELAGLAPGPFCGMVLADFGASVIKVDKVGSRPVANRLNRGKRAIALDLKQKSGIEIVRRMCKKSDVFIEPFRAGITEKLGLGPKELLADNPGLVYARLTGFGQNGPWAKRAGHDINYAALSGVLSLLGRKGEKPTPPVNLLADFAGGGLLCSLGIVMALFERTQSGKGQVIDVSMSEGAAYVSSFLFQTQDNPIMFGRGRGANLLDTGAPIYDTYKTADSKYLSVGALESQFHAELFNKLGLNTDEMRGEMFAEPDKCKDKIANIFASKTRDEWMQVFENSDACVVPVLEVSEVGAHIQNASRRSFVSYKSESDPSQSLWEPQPAPKLSRTPAEPRYESIPDVEQHSQQILEEIGYNSREIGDLVKSGVVSVSKTNSKL